MDVKKLEDISKAKLIQQVDYFSKRADFYEMANSGMSNGSAIGYAMMAFTQLEYNEDTIKKVERCMYVLMDEKTEEEAEKFYQNN